MTSEKIKDILCHLGYKLSDFGNHWRTNALYRGGDNPMAVQVYKNSGVWFDFVKGSSHLPFKSLVEATLQSSDPNEVKKLLSGYDFEPTSLPVEQSKPKISMEKIYDDSILQKLLPHYKFYKDKGISENILKFLKSGLATEGAMYQRYVFPIYNESEKIHGFSGRDMSKSKNDRPKWKHLGKKTNWIYPYYIPFSDKESVIKESIKEQNEVILVESIGDMLNLFENNIFNVLVTFGTVASSSLICFLTSLGNPRIVLSLNNDFDKDSNRGKIGCYKSLLKMLNFIDLDRIILHLPTEKDFGDMNAKQIMKWFLALKNKDNSFNKENYKKDILSLIKSKEIASGSFKQKYFDE